MSGSIVIRDGITPTLQDLAAQYPREFQGALKDLGARWRRIMAAEMRSGAPAGVPFAPLHPLTKRARKQQELTLTFTRGAAIKSLRRQARLERVAKTSQRAADLKRRAKSLRAAYDNLGFGGRLPRLFEWQVGAGFLQIGFLGKTFARADRSAARWMRAESRGWTKPERRWLHVLYGQQIPFAGYDRPERPPVEPQRDRFVADADAVIRKSIERRLSARKGPR